MIKVNIDEAIARIDDWKGKEISYEVVPGGLTNPNFKVTVDGENWFLKIPGEGTDFIDRDNCHMANLIASETGVGPKAGWYDEVEAMQGRYNTYYAGEVMSFGDMEETAEYSRDLVERFF